MKTKGRAIAALATLLMALPLFSMPAGAANSHKVTLKHLTVTDVDTNAGTITATDSTPTTYTINYTKKTKFVRASGEKFRISGLLELMEDDTITVWGKTTDGTTINALKVKNNNTRKTKGLYLATIVDIAPEQTGLPGDLRGAFLMLKVDNEISVAYTYGYTKFWFGKTRIKYADLQEGDVISIQGVIRTIDDDFDLILNTTKVKVRRHGEVPDFPLEPSFFRFSH